MVILFIHDPHCYYCYSSLNCSSNQIIQARCQKVYREYTISSHLVSYQWGLPSKLISDVYNGSAPLRQNVSNALPNKMTRAPRRKHLWRQHGITGGTLARILAPIWFADLFADGEPYFKLYNPFSNTVFLIAHSPYCTPSVPYHCFHALLYQFDCYLLSIIASPYIMLCRLSTLYHITL